MNMTAQPGLPATKPVPTADDAVAPSKDAIPLPTERPQPRGDLTFIETQLPVAKLSIESYRERKAGSGQTLTGLGKWWGRKPLVLCRAVILGLLLPATTDPRKDREVFLRLMTMDDDGLLRRKSKSIPASELFKRLPPADRTRYFQPGSSSEEAKLKAGLSKEDKKALQHRVFLSLPYNEKLDYCDRPEHIDGPSAESWAVINAHLGTSAASLQELVAELGRRRFGHVPRVGDAFCGGGSIPFEAARLGCEAYASDLNPVAALLTWAALHIVGGGPEVARQVQEAQRRIYDEVDRQITEWGIEHREPDPSTGRRWRADAYLYCTECTCPECGWRVPMAPSWVIAEKTRVIARLVPDPSRKRYDFEILESAPPEVFESAKRGTVVDSALICPHCGTRTDVSVIRGDGRGSFGESQSLLRPWENRDVVPREGDIFGERLYCIRWVDTWTEKVPDGRGGWKEKTFSERHYRAPTDADLAREAKVLELLMQRFDDWQAKGYIPSRRIEPGNETTRLNRERGWTHWHHLFTPRQLLVSGCLYQCCLSRADPSKGDNYVLPFLLKVVDWNSRLSRWHSSRDSVEQTFSNQALNTLYNFGSRGLLYLANLWFTALPPLVISPCSRILAEDAKLTSCSSDAWITDPPYADAVNYEEVSEFFLAWLAAGIERLFPEWGTDSRRALAIKGNGETFATSMVACYRRLAELMPDNGLQVVMFTHQDAGVWADLTLILWAAGLRVTAAWCIATETESDLKEGNYVQGTVLLVCRKRTATASAFLDEVYQDVEAEVKRQLDAMRDLDDASEPNFSDTDYQLAAYAAALRVLTGRTIEEIDVERELTRVRSKGEKNPVEQVIRRAVQIACDHLIPRGVHRHLWRGLTPLERLYLKGLELECHGERRVGVYQELARGFGVEEYKPLLFSAKANEARLKTASEFGRKEMGGDGFGATLLRQALFAVFKTVETEDPRAGIHWLRSEVADYATHRASLIELLEHLAKLAHVAVMPHWARDAAAAGLLAGALRNRQDNV